MINEVVTWLEHLTESEQLHLLHLTSIKKLWTEKIPTSAPAN